MDSLSKPLLKTAEVAEKLRIASSENIDLRLLKVNFSHIDNFSFREAVSYLSNECLLVSFLAYVHGEHLSQAF